MISADTLGVDGGNIDLNLNALVMRNNGQISTSVGNVDAGGNGGNIILNSGAILALPRANADISANAFRGNGGKIEINTQGIFGFSIDSQPTIETNDITASSQFGISGTVTLNTPDVDPSRGTIELPATVLDRSNQISQTCAPQKAIASSFVRSGRGSLPPSPLDTLQGEPNSPELATVGSNSENYSDRISSLPNASSIIEAQGWVKDAQGKVTLVANSNTATTYPQTLGSCH